MRFRLLYLGTITTLCLLAAASAWPQDRGTQSGQMASPNTGQLMMTPVTTSISGSLGGLLVAVFGEDRTVLDRQAVVKAVHKDSLETSWQTTGDHAEATLSPSRVGTYEIEVSAVGYLTTTSQVVIPDIVNHYRVEINLKKDPTAIELSVPTPPQMPAKARKQMSQGVADLKSGKLKQAQKHLNAANQLVPSNPEVKFLLGYLSFQQKDFKQAEAYLIDASTLDPRNVQALALLGRLQIQRQDYAAAEKTLGQATTTDPGYWMAHSLLAETYLKQQEYEKAREQAQLAIDRGRGAGNSAEIALGQALEKLGRDQEALQAYRKFVTESPSSPMAAQVRTMYNDLRQRVSSAPGNSQPVPKEAPFSPGADALLAASEPGFSTRTWGPPGIDDVRPLVAEGVTCPFEQVIHEVGERTKQLLDDIAKFSAIEDLLHEDLDALGHPVTRTVLKFNYVASISEPQPGVFDVGEFRSPGTDSFPDQIATRGLPSVALIFHPDERDDFQMVCEGLGDWHGEATWLVRFQQREDRPRRVQDYRIGRDSYPISLKGRAWISADGFHLVHLESDLISPMPEIRLLGEHIAVDYAPQLFQKKSVQLWLPKNAELYFDFRGHHYFRRHSFDHFMLFSVEAEEKPKEKAQGAVKEPPIPPQ